MLGRINPSGKIQCSQNLSQATDKHALHGFLHNINLSECCQDVNQETFSILYQQTSFPQKQLDFPIVPSKIRWP